jgi:hypothetical protein
LPKKALFWLYFASPHKLGVLDPHIRTTTAISL